MEMWIAVMGTLLGTAIGTLGGYLITLRAQAAVERNELLQVRRAAYLEWLDRTAELYEAIQVVHLECGPDKPDQAAATRRLSALSGRPGQTALERLRLMCHEEVCAAAAQRWQHMRSHPVAIGHTFEGKARRRWRSEYWEARRRFIDAARHETGQSELDWKRAGAQLYRSEESVRASWPHGFLTKSTIPVWG